MNKRNCDQCGTEFSPYTKRSRFCRAKCKDAWNNKHKQQHAHTCAGCGITFMTSQKKSKYCGVSCGLKHGKPVKTCACVDCGITFTFEGRTKREHCDVCTPTWESKRQMEWRAAKDPSIQLGVGGGGAQWGAKNHSWKPADEHLSLRYRANWRRRCFKLWPKVCCACGSSDAIEVHHVNGDPADFSAGNLIPLCFECHIHRVHKRRYKSASEYVQATMAILPEECRIKIAELSVNTCEVNANRRLCVQS